MAHNDYVRPDGQWYNQIVPVPKDLQAFDVAQYQSLNGDAGGTWNPASPVVLGASGLSLTGNNHTLSGGVATLRGGRVVLHGANPWPTFNSSQSRTLVVPFVNMRPLTANSYQFGVSVDPVGVKIVDSGSAQMEWTFPKRFLHHNAQLSSATITFIVGSPHLNVPAVAPSFQIIRYVQGRGSSVDLGPATSPTLPGTAALWYNNGQPQTWTYPTTHNAGIDVSLWQYTIQLTDEGGSGALPGNVYTSIALTFGSIATTQYE